MRFGRACVYKGAVNRIWVLFNFGYYYGSCLILRNIYSVRAKKKRKETGLLFHFKMREKEEE